MKPLQKLCTTIILFTLCCQALAQSPDKAVCAIITQQVNKPKNAQFYYPKSVTRFYRQQNYQPVWLNLRDSQAPTWKAMLVLDCVLQFGLSHDDYHPGQLRYGLLHDMLETPKLVTDAQRAEFDMMLTDAMIALINHLHYGKLNPDYGALRLDNGMDVPLMADETLRKIIAGPDLFAGISNVQPKSNAYVSLQTWMNKWKGQFEGDCYEVPEADVRRVAINMERLRWADINDSSAYIQVNIPTFSLTYHLADTDRVFKVVVGKPQTPTPVLQSRINYLTTSPEWQVPDKIFREELLPKATKDIAYLAQNSYVLYDREGIVKDIDLALLKEIARHPAGYYARQSSGCDNALGMVVFRFANRYDVYLHDTPEQQLFGRKNRALSHGCVRLQNAASLAQLVLQQDGQPQAAKQVNRNIAKQKRQNFNLNKPLPVMITYLTCEIKDGELVTFNDVYQLDKRLEMALYQFKDELTKR